MPYYLDFEAYFCGGKYIVKEIALLAAKTGNVKTWHLMSPKNICVNYNSPTIKFQYERHQLCWDCGNISLSEAMFQIGNIVYLDTVFY